SFQIRIKQLEDVSLARSCRRLHHHVFSLLQRAYCLLLPEIRNNQPRSKPGNHFWKMFAVWPACNGADGISDIEHVAIGYRAGRRQRSQGSWRKHWEVRVIKVK